MANPGKASPVDVEKHLKGIDFPASKDDLIEHASSTNAPEDVMSVLHRMPERDFDNAADVAKGVGEAE